MLSVRERVDELKKIYESNGDFEFEAIAKLEEEYIELSETNPEYTLRRKEILEMRRRLLGFLELK